MTCAVANGMPARPALPRTIGTQSETGNAVLLDLLLPLWTQRVPRRQSVATLRVTVLEHLDHQSLIGCDYRLPTRSHNRATAQVLNHDRRIPGIGTASLCIQHNETIIAPSNGLDGSLLEGQLFSSDRAADRSGPRGNLNRVLRKRYSGCSSAATEYCGKRECRKRPSHCFPPQLELVVLRSSRRQDAWELTKVVDAPASRSRPPGFCQCACNRGNAMAERSSPPTCHVLRSPLPSAHARTCLWSIAANQAHNRGLQATSLDQRLPPNRWQRFGRIGRYQRPNKIRSARQ